MKMVASAKLKKAQNMAEQARPFFNKTKNILSDIVKYSRDVREHPLLHKKEGNKHLYITIGADRGLCGAYNNKIINVCRALLQSHVSTAFFLPFLPTFFLPAHLCRTAHSCVSHLLKSAEKLRHDDLECLCDFTTITGAQVSRVSGLCNTRACYQHILK
jgi:hypothetical protein